MLRRESSLMVVLFLFLFSFGGIPLSEANTRQQKFTTYTAPVDVASGSSSIVQIELGGEHSLPGSGHRVVFSKVIFDKRCPENRLCITPGEAQVELHLHHKDNKTVHVVTLEGLVRKARSTSGNPIFLSTERAGNDLELMVYSLDPYPGFAAQPSVAYPKAPTISILVTEKQSGSKKDKKK